MMFRKCFHMCVFIKQKKNVYKRTEEDWLFAKQRSQRAIIQMHTHIIRIPIYDYVVRSIKFLVSFFHWADVNQGKEDSKHTALEGNHIYNFIFKLFFIYSLCLSHHASGSHLCPVFFVSALCLWNLPANKVKFKRKKK